MIYHSTSYDFSLEYLDYAEKKTGNLSHFMFGIVCHFFERGDCNGFIALVV